MNLLQAHDRSMTLADKVMKLAEKGDIEGALAIASGEMLDLAVKYGGPEVVAAAKAIVAELQSKIVRH